MYKNENTAIKIHKQKAKRIGLYPVAFRSFIDMVVPTKKSVSISSFLEKATIECVAASGTR